MEHNETPMTLSPDTCKPMTKPLSPAAQAVMDAVHSQDAEPYPLIVAAALRAVVDQTFPDQRDIETELIRSDQLAIATELEGFSE